MDATKAPQGLCKHRLAFGLYRRASELLATSSAGGPQPAAAAQTTLPEAPASVNVRVLIEGRDCQLTLRDSDEDRLLTRLEALLARYPQAEYGGKGKGEQASAPAQTTPSETPTCPVHGPMQQSSKAPGTFFCSKKIFDGSYCKERFPKN